jgi:hypothetical protein
MRGDSSAKAILEAEYETHLSPHDVLVLWGRKQTSSTPALVQLHAEVRQLVETRRDQITRGQLKLKHGSEGWRASGANSRPIGKTP